MIATAPLSSPVIFIVRVVFICFAAVEEKKKEQLQMRRVGLKNRARGGLEREESAYNL